MAVIIAAPSANIDSRSHLIMAVEGLGKIQIDTKIVISFSGSARFGLTQMKRAGISVLARK